MEFKNNLNDLALLKAINIKILTRGSSKDMTQHPLGQSASELQLSADPCTMRKKATVTRAIIVLISAWLEIFSWNDLLAGYTLKNNVTIFKSKSTLNPKLRYKRCWFNLSRFFLNIWQLVTQNRWKLGFFW